MMTDPALEFERLQKEIKELMKQKNPDLKKISELRAKLWELI